MKTFGWLLLVPVGLAALLAGGSGCARISSAAPNAAESASEAPAVTTVHPERKDFRRLVDQPGQIIGVEQTALYAKIGGYVEALKVDEGDRVRQGQLLALLSVPETVEELKQKEAAVAQAEQSLEVAKANLTKMQAAVRLAKATANRAEASLVRWKAQYERDRRLATSRTVDQEQLEQTTDQFRSAEAAKAEAAAAVQSAEASEVESAAQVKKVEADINFAKADRDRQAALVAYREIRAPFDGVITHRDVNVDKGHLLMPTGAQLNNGLPIFHLARTDPVRIFVEVPEADAPLIHDGAAARVMVPSLGEREFDGKVTRSSFALDPQARTLRVQIEVPNPDGELRPGNYAKARITAERPQVLTAPVSAVILRDDQAFVVRVEDGKAVWTPVKLGQRNGESVELLKKQTQPAGADGRRTWESWTGAEEIVRSNPSALTDGQVVRVEAVPAVVAQVMDTR